jgi:anion-transporting  ArsA/GET3 family ATPase
MAMEKLYELHEGAAFDLIVIDTPPTRNALDFLEAPGHLTRFLDHRLYRMLMAPTRGVVKAVNVATQAFLRTISRVVGGEVVKDAITFFQAFDGMEQGFIDRARHVQQLLTAESTAFVLVASPRQDTVTEATFFARKLAEAGLSVRALIVNRMHQRFGDGRPELARERATTFAGQDLGGLYANLADFQQVALDEEHNLDALARELPHATIARVPFLRSDVHDLDGLDEVSHHLFPAVERRSA